MRGDLRGWLGLVIVGLVSIATSKPIDPQSQRVLHAEIFDEITLIDGQTAVTSYKIRLAAEANVASGVSREASVGIPLIGCADEEDGGVTCTPAERGPVTFSFTNGQSVLPLFAGCAVGVDCEETVQVETRLVSGPPRTVKASLNLGATVKNAGLRGLDDRLTITPE